jgi:hypothetical protein
MGTAGGKIGCAAAVIVGLPFLGLAMFVRFYGDCGEARECHRGEGVSLFVILALTAVVACAAGLFTRLLVNWFGARPR